MEHFHGLTGRLVAGCGACDMQKAARDLAIHHLHEALNLLGLIGGDDKKTIRLNMSPIGVTGDDTFLCHSVDLTAKQAESIADEVDSLNHYAAVDQPAPAFEEFYAYMRREGNGNSQADREAFVADNQDMAADLVDLFSELDPREINRTVLDRREVDLPTAVRALDDVFGEIADPYADEDDA
jgi:Fe-S-cluster formation regulator IscX/YfhJ